MVVAYGVKCTSCKSAYDGQCTGSSASEQCACSVRAYVWPAVAEWSAKQRNELGAPLENNATRRAKCFGGHYNAVLLVQRVNQRFADIDIKT